MQVSLQRPLAAVFMSVSLMLAPQSLAVAESASPHAMILPVDPAPLVAETASGPKRFSIEIADDEEERSRGLMFRERMADTQGMLFLFEETRPVGFWMQNTPMPLDLLFIGEDGRLRAIGRGVPFSTDLIPSGEPVRFVLELKEGTAQKMGIAIGDRIRHPTIDAIAGGS